MKKLIKIDRKQNAYDIYDMLWEELVNKIRNSGLTLWIDIIKAVLFIVEKLIYYLITRKITALVILILEIIVYINQSLSYVFLKLEFYIQCYK